MAKSNTPQRAGDTRREGKKSIPWKDDPEILERLARVAEYLNQNKRALEIAQLTKVAIATARLDISRVRQLWKEEARERLANAQDFSIAQYEEVIKQAWVDLKNIKSTNSPMRAALLNVIIKAQARLDAVSGIAERHELSGPDGGPIEVKPVNVEKIRQKRWAQVAPSLAALQQKESNNERSAKEEKPE